MKFDNEKFASLYNRQQDESGYPGRLLPFVLGQLSGCSSIIDIGAGTGFFTIPLLQNGHRVTAVEPSTGMAAILMNKTGGIDTTGLTLKTEKWEDWTGPHHDASISIHSLYPMNSRRQALEKMIRFSSKRIIIIRNPGEMKTITGLIRSELGLHEIPDLNIELADLLRSLAVDNHVAEIREERDTIIHNLDEEVDSIMFRTELSPGLRDRVRGIIINNTRPVGDLRLYSSRFCDNAYIF